MTCLSVVCLFSLLSDFKLLRYLVLHVTYAK